MAHAIKAAALPGRLLWRRWRPRSKCIIIHGGIAGLSTVLGHGLFALTVARPWCCVRIEEYEHHETQNKLARRNELQHILVLQYVLQKVVANLWAGTKNAARRCPYFGQCILSTHPESFLSAEDGLGPAGILADLAGQLVVRRPMPECTYVKNNACVQVWRICVVGKVVVRVGPFFTQCPRIAESIDIRTSQPAGTFIDGPNGI